MLTEGDTEPVASRAGTLGGGSDASLPGIEAAAGGHEAAATSSVLAAAVDHVLLWLFWDTLPPLGSARATVSYFTAAPVRPF